MTDDAQRGSPIPEPSPKPSWRQRLATLGVQAFTHCCYYAMRAIVWLPFKIDCFLQRRRKQREAE